jgi:hypothetical protein
MTDTNEICHYLEAAPADMSGTLAWVSSVFSSVPDISGMGRAIGTGRKNTTLILAVDANAPAAKACKEYSNGGKTDWFLPSQDEQNELPYNSYIDGLDVSNGYWSSSQYDFSPAKAIWRVLLYGEGMWSSEAKTSPYLVRAVRAF